MTSLALACRLGAGSPITLPRRVRAILAKYSATMLLPGVSGVLRFGYQPGNYRESTGQTLAAADQQVGLVVDAARSPGPELVPSLDFMTWTATAAVTNRTANSFTTNAIGGLIYTIPSGSGKTYRINISGTSTATLVVRNSSNSNGQVVISAGSFNVPITSPAMHETNGQLYLALQTAGTLSNVTLSIRELPGIHASQSTSGYQPVLRRGLLNLMLWSSDVGNVAWGKTAVTTSGSLVSETTANSAHELRTPSLSLVSGTAYTQAARIAAGTRRYVRIGFSGAFGAGAGYAVFDTQTGAVTFTSSASVAADIAADPQGGWIATVRYTVQTTASATNYIGINTNTTTGTSYMGDPAENINVHSGALFQGTVTAEEIIAAGGIPVTTSAPASSANGIQSWQFDGTDDRLSLSAVPFQMQDDHFFVAPIRAPQAVSATNRIFSISSSTSNTPRICDVYVNSSGNVVANYLNNAGALGTITGTSDVRGVDSVIAVTQISGVRKLYVNGVLEGSNSVVLGAATVDTATLGALVIAGGAVTGFHNGRNYGTNLGKGAITDAELLTLERFMASLQGRTL